MFYQTSMGLIYLIFNQLPFLWDTSAVKINKITASIHFRIGAVIYLLLVGSLLDLRACKSTDYTCQSNSKKDIGDYLMTGKSEKNYETHN